MITIPRTQFDGTDEELQQRVADFRAALTAHAATVGVPAPREDDLIEQLARGEEEFQLEALPPAPEPLTLEQLKAVKNAQINTARLEANFSKFSFGGKDIACDQLSRSDIDGVASYVALNNALPPGFPGAWKAMDNSFVPIGDVATFKAMIAAMVATGIANFVYAQQLKGQLAAAQTPEDVNAIAWQP